MNVLTALTVFAVIFPAELPDKSLFASLVLGSRLRPLWTWVGISAAFVLHVLIAIAAGGLLTLLPPRVVTGVVALLFAFAAGWMLLSSAGEDHSCTETGPREESAGEDTRREESPVVAGAQVAGAPTASQVPAGQSCRAATTAAGAHIAPARPNAQLGFGRTFWMAFGVVFIGEWGDITQIATANLAAKYDDPLSVGVGAAMALCAVAGLAVMLGRSLLRWVPVRVVRRVAGVILAVLAVISLVQLALG